MDIQPARPHTMSFLRTENLVNEWAAGFALAQGLNWRKLSEAQYDELQAIRFQLRHVRNAFEELCEKALANE
jgi:hypothetical protein